MPLLQSSRVPVQKRCRPPVAQTHSSQCRAKTSNTLLGMVTWGARSTLSKPRPIHRSGSAIQMCNSTSTPKTNGEQYCKQMKSAESVLTWWRDTDDPRHERFAREFCFCHLKQAVPPRQPLPLISKCTGERLASPSFAFKPALTATCKLPKVHDSGAHDNVLWGKLTYTSLWHLTSVRYARKGWPEL
jgi:hypothetical protein